MPQKPRRIDLAPDNFLAGIGVDLEADELGLYWLICLKIYSACGPIPYDVEGFSTLLHKTDMRIIKRASSRLQVLGKITVSDGYVMAKGCLTPLEDARKRIATASENGHKGGRPSNKTKEIDKPAGFVDGKLPSPSLPPSPPPSPIIEAAKPPKASRSKPRNSLPENFPEDGNLKWAQDHWLKKGRADLCNRMGDEVQKFRDHHTAKGTKSADWSASWRTWAQNAMDFSKVNRNGNGAYNNGQSQSSRGSFASAISVAAAERAAERLQTGDGTLFGDSATEQITDEDRKSAIEIRPSSV